MSQAAPYAYITLATARQQVANRLYDSAQTFWSSSELTAYLLEALRTWNALTSYWRGDFTFPSQQGITWMDLTDTVAMPKTLRPYTVTDDTLYRVIQFHLLEPSTGINPWAGVSLQYTTDDLLNAVSRRRDEILSTTACTQTRHLFGAVAERITLPDSIIDVRRMAYLPNLTVLTGAGFGSGRFGFGAFGISAPPGIGIPRASVLFAEDAWAEQSFNRNYTRLPAGAPGTPSTYLLSTQPPLSFDTDVPPAFAGNYEVLSVDAGVALIVGTPQTLSIPDDWTHVIKWGALADLFNKESNAKDSLRAAYCEQRYRMGLSLLTNAPALLAMRVGNQAVQIDSLRGADLYNTFWQSATPGQPDTILYSGMNLIALTPMPDAGPYSLTATVVENAPVPVADGDFLQVGRDDLDAIIDYAVHLAALKMGGSEFTATMPLLERFLQQAGLYNKKLLELGEFTSVLLGLASSEKNINPVTITQGES